VEQRDGVCGEENFATFGEARFFWESTDVVHLLISLRSFNLKKT